MVARGEDTGDAPNDRRAARFLPALFLIWRRWVTIALVTAPTRISRPIARAARASGRSAGVALARARAGVAGSGAALFRRWRLVLSGLAVAFTGGALTRALPALGAISLAAGAALALALARPLGSSLAEATIAVVWTLGWAGLRFGILRAALPGTSGVKVSRAWAVGLLPAIASVTDVSRLAVLVVSAWLTAGALRREGVGAPDARRAAAWAFGVELLATGARAFGSVLLLYFVATR